MHKFILTLAIATGALLSACLPESNKSQENTLIGSTWTVEMIDNQAVADGSGARIIFDAEGRVGGSTGCNNFSAQYEKNDGKLIINAPALTRKMCDPALNTQEQNFMAVFNVLTAYEFQENNTLILKTSDGKSISAKKLP